MATAKQIDANRNNARKSTGPRTPEGKAITCLNAVQHGLTGQLTFVAPTDRAAWIALSQPLTASLNPMGPQELHLAARIVSDTWRLHRAAANEENIYALGLLDSGHTSESTIIVTGDCADPALAVAISHAETYFNRTRDFDRLSLYEQRLNRSLHKNYALLRKLQFERNRPVTNSVPRSRRVWRRPESPTVPERPTVPEPGRGPVNGLVYADCFADLVTYVDDVRIVLEKGIPDSYYVEKVAPDCWLAC